MANILSSQSEQLPQMDGIIVLDKPAGLTSAACLKFLKKIGQKKIGHAGTLDPMATGVLLALLGQATKIASCLLQDGGKVYWGQLRLGQETDTWDAEGKIMAESDPSNLDEALIKERIQAWQGESEQTVPPYSAAKFNGKPLYRLARSGQATPEKVKKIFVYKADMLNFSMPFVEFRVSCGSGAYIRSLAHSLGKRLGCGAVLTKLRREYSAPFDLKDAIDPRDLRDNPYLLAKMLKPLEAGLPKWARIGLNKGEAVKIRQGQAIFAKKDSPDRAILFEGDTPLALARQEEGQWKIQRGLWN